MSSSHQHQVNQVKHTNIAIVRIKKAGHHFEVPAYRNQVLAYRSGAETKLEEVLQVVQVFDNVSRGLHSKAQDLEKAFGTSDVEACCKMILQKGEVQVSDKERQTEYEQKFHDIATLVANRCVNTQTGWPFTVQTIETAMKETIHFSVNPTRPAKQQAMEVIEKLKAHLPIARARMHLKVSAARDEGLTKEAVLSVAGDGAEILNSNDTSVEILVDPSKFREIEKLAKRFEGSVSILEFGSQAAGEADLDTVIVSSSATSSQHAPDAEKATPQPPAMPRKPVAATAAAVKDEPKLHCLSCGVEFVDRTMQRAHYKTDFHTYNVKLKQIGLPTVTDNEFANMSEADKRAVLFDWKS